MIPNDSRYVIHSISMSVTNTKLVEMIIDKLQETKWDLHPDTAALIWNILNAKWADKVKKILEDELEEIKISKYRYLTQKEAEDKQFIERMIDGFNWVI